jgi:periplasmic protein TonB
LRSPLCHPKKAVSDRLDILATVRGAARPARPGRLPIAIVVALAAHALLIVGLEHVALAPEQAITATPYEIDVARIPPSAPPNAQPEQAAAEKRSLPPRIHDARAPHTRVSEAQAAQAATVVAQPPAPGAPVDLTADTVVTGTANAYAGGVTSSTGTSSSAVPEKRSADAPGAALPLALPDRSGPVSRESEHWSCPWPREADAEQIDEQTVILQVVVDRTGAAATVTVLADPGHGFGSTAAACAMRTRFTPARNRSGEPVRSTSPPIRVRFSR